MECELRAHCLNEHDCNIVPVTLVKLLQGTPAETAGAARAALSGA